MKMLRANFKRVGRCHPWCGNREYGIGRTREKCEWKREAEEASSQFWRDEY